MLKSFKSNKGGYVKFIVLGRYTEQGLGGFVKNPSDNRQEAAKKITEAAGAKLIEMMTLRGAYDFIAIVEGSNFETAAGMKMLMEATGTIKDMTIMAVSYTHLTLPTILRV